MAMKIESIFTTQIAQGKMSGASKLNAALLKEVRSLSEQDRMGQDWSRDNYKGGYTSYASLNDLHHRAPALADFSERLLPFALQFAKTLRWEMRGLRLEMTDLWMNIMPLNTYHTLHNHPHSVLSGAYYLQSPPESVALRLEDPRLPYFMNAPIRKGGGGLYFEIPPVPGTFVMFESWLRHAVPPNRSKRERISLSFNYAFREI